MIKKQLINITLNKNSLAFLMMGLMIVMFASYNAVSVSALTDVTRPTILFVSPVNNQLNVKANEPITVRFSEDMDPSTINTNTFTVSQSTDPKFDRYRTIGIIDETINYADRKATFTPDYRLIIDEVSTFAGRTERVTPNSPNQLYDNKYDNVFTVTITTGVKDLAGNSLAQNYVWKFTTVGDMLFIPAYTQANQNFVPVNVSSIASSAVPINGKQEATINFPLLANIGALILIVLAVLILSMLLKPTPKKNRNTSPPNPFGDVHPVVDLEGIGPVYKKQLHAIGIKNTEQLWQADSAKIASETGAPLSSIKSWQHMAELASVKDIGPQYAELLERSGIHSIVQLMNCSPNKLLKLVREKQDSLKVRIQGNFPGHAMVEHWISEARNHEFGAA